MGGDIVEREKVQRELEDGMMKSGMTGGKGCYLNQLWVYLYLRRNTRPGWSNRHGWLPRPAL